MPVLLACIPFGFVLGTVAQARGLTLVQVPLLTGLNFAGGSEFAALGLWTSPPNVLLIVAITFLVNSRLILMSAVMAPMIAHLPRGRAMAALFFMCDESWAMALADAAKRRESGEMRLSVPFFMGSGVGIYLIWISTTTLGAMAGPLLGDPRVLGLDMAFPAVFLSLLKGMWKGWRAAIPWGLSLVCAVLVYVFVPGAWYVPAGALTGVAAAFVLAEDRQ
ncbi:MAG: AzlC family ABC transporter permease [Desulfovibrionaceae bacterium]|nr:AzlC family ABC transporter permease [Desulfovibrionaceae bacterium]